VYGSRYVPSLRGHRSQDLHNLNCHLRSDENRGNLLEAGFPQTVVILLESYSESIPPKRRLTDPLPIHPEDLKIVKTAVGVILNVSLGYGRSFTLKFGNLLTAFTFQQNPSGPVYSPWKWRSPSFASRRRYTRLVRGCTSSHLLRMQSEGSSWKTGKCELASPHGLGEP